MSNNYVLAKKICVYKAAVVHLKLLMHFSVRAACFVAYGQEGQFTHTLIFNYQHIHWWELEEGSASVAFQNYAPNLIFWNRMPFCFVGKENKLHFKTTIYKIFWLDSQCTCVNLCVRVWCSFLTECTFNQIQNLTLTYTINPLWYPTSKQDAWHLSEGTALSTNCPLGWAPSCALDIWTVI